MSTDTIGDEAEELTIVDWCTCIAIIALILGWITSLGMVAWSAIEWLISL